MLSSLVVQHQAPDTARFREEVLEGLRNPQKELPCKYFYDERGSRLFDAICEQPEYYLTRNELGIMRRYAREMADRLGGYCYLIEFGSGSSLKTRLLLDCLPKPAAYVPVDISGTHLERSARSLAARYPELDILPVCADFTQAFGLPPSIKPVQRRAVYFPGSTIGNFGPAEAIALLRGIHDLCGLGGCLLIGIDLKKDVEVLNRAYNDRAGVTRDFNLNVLRRINRELGADFALDQFKHHAFYNEDQGRIEMHLISRRAQTVYIGDARVTFAKDEAIRTECSYKHTVDEFAALSGKAGWQVEQAWTDGQQLFSVLSLTAR